MKRLTCILLALVPAILWGKTVIFTPDNSNFCNPERGFYYHSEQKVSSSGETNLSASTFSEARHNGSTLLLRLYYFDRFRTQDLPEAVLTQINSDFTLFRQHGCKAVLRFAYTNDNDNYPIKDASPEIWKRHIEQLKPVLQANADVIAVVQAGFIGAWGEWYFSSQGTGSGIKQAKKDSLINQLLDAVPASRCIQLRTPNYKRDYLRESEPMPAEEAFTGTPRARIGHHNDAFLYQADNMGTYSNRTIDMDYLAEECLYLPNGGETDVYREEVYKGWATGDKAQAEMAKLHYSYLNQGYAELTLNHWRADGSFDILARHMGYRFQLLEATLPAVQRPNADLPVHLNIKNVGYASPFNERHAYFLLIGSDTTYILPLESNPRYWAPNSVITLIDEDLSLPADIQEGDYEAGLWLPDADPRIAADARFAIRLANEGVWEETTGYNRLGIQITVSASAPEPEPDPEPTPDPELTSVSNFRGTAGLDMVNLTWTNPGQEKDLDTIYVDMSLGRDTTSELMKPGEVDANVTYENGVSSVTYTTHEDWLWAGVRFPVNHLTDIKSVSFDCKGDGQTIYMYPYAHDGQYLWRGSGYSVILNNTSWQSCSYVPSSALWFEPEYNFGEQPIIDLGFAANPATAQSGAFSIRNLMYTCKHTYVSNVAGVRIIRKLGAAPTDYNDGMIIYYGPDNHCIDADLIYGQTYYYAAYVIYKDGQISAPAICQVTVDGSHLTDIPMSGTSAATKCLSHGHVYIIRNGQTYSILGLPL